MAPGFGFGYCGFPMSFPGFYFSQINWDMTHEQGRYNIAANLMNETMTTNNLMYQVRDLRYNQGFTNPYFGPMSLPDPKQYAAQLQPQLNAMFQAFMNNINNQANAANNNNNVNNPNTGDPKKNECIRLRGILQDFQTLNNTKSIYGKGSATEEKIAAALNKTGTDDEILAALKDAVQYIATNYKDQLRNMLLGKDGILGMLTVSGYNMSPSVKEADDQNETNENTLVGQVVNELKNCPETPDKSYFAAALTVFKSDKEELILRRLSYLNDKTSADGKSYIQMLVDVNKNGKWKDNQNWQNLVKFSSESLINKGIKVATTITDADLKKKVEDAYGDLTAKKNAYVAAYDQAKATDFVKSFNNLYAMLRLVTAQLAQNTVRTEYGYLNNTVANLIDDDLIVAETKTDLQNEKIGTIPTVDLGKMRTKVEVPAGGGGSDPAKTPAEIVKDLNGKGVLSAVKKIAGQGEYYETKNTAGTYGPKRYYAIKDGKLVELKGVTNINASGKCTIKGETTTSDLKDVISNNSEEVSSEDIENYKKFADAINKKTSDGTIKKTAAQDVNGEYTVFKSKTGKFYALKDDKVYSIDRDALIKSKQNVNGTTALNLSGLIGSEVSATEIA